MSAVALVSSETEDDGLVIQKAVGLRGITPEHAADEVRKDGVRYTGHDSVCIECPMLFV
jgi:hypothetical protein